MENDVLTQNDKKNIVEIFNTLTEILDLLNLSEIDASKLKEKSRKLEEIIGPRKDAFPFFYLRNKYIDNLHRTESDKVEIAYKLNSFFNYVSNREWFNGDDRPHFDRYRRFLVELKALYAEIS